MSTLHKLKAYFGMIPADDGYGVGYDRYPADDGYGVGYPDDAEYGGYDDRGTPAAGRPRVGYRVPVDELDDMDVPVRGRARPRAPEPVVAGALAMDRQPEPVARLRPVAEHPRQMFRDPLSRIVTLHPSGYAEARAIGEHFRDGNPVIMNLTEMANADAKRLVDFAAGLAFALRGTMDKVTNKVFLLSPPDIDVTAEDRRRIAEGGMFLRR
ncbi:MAG: cell division protein SepF [Pseudonocardiaceae bacterium]